jgi:N-glycosylase/DNA lyase
MPKNLHEIKLDLEKTPFNLDSTLSCGQVFRWEKQGDWWHGVVDKAFVKVKQKVDTLQFETSPKSDVDAAFLSNYFRLDDDLPDIYSKIVKDKFVKAVVKKFYGLRLMRQEPWECLISYMCATNKNIPAIKNMIANLCKYFGEKIQTDGGESYAFPTPLSLAEASLRELRLCKLGFRAERVKNAAGLVSEGTFSLDGLKKLSYEEAKKKLMTLPGVGPKVADCVLLFSFCKLEAFPIDVWMKRIILEFYADHFEHAFVERARVGKSPSPREYKAISLFGRQYFGEYIGYAQEYLYHFRRCQS